MHKISRKVNKQQFYYCLSCGKKKMVKKTRLANEKVPLMNQKKRSHKWHASALMFSAAQFVYLNVLSLWL